MATKTKTSNGWAICPFSKKSLVKDRLKIYYYNSNGINKIVNLFLSDQNSFKVWILICDDMNPQEECKKLRLIYR